MFYPITPRKFGVKGHVNIKKNFGKNYGKKIDDVKYTPINQYKKLYE